MIPEKKENAGLMLGICLHPSAINNPGKAAFAIQYPVM